MDANDFRDAALNATARTEKQKQSQDPRSSAQRTKFSHAIVVPPAAGSSVGFLVGGPFTPILCCRHISPHSLPSITFETITATVSSPADRWL